MTHQRFQRFDLDNQSKTHNRYTVTVGYFDIPTVEQIKVPIAAI